MTKLLLVDDNAGEAIIVSAALDGMEIDLVAVSDPDAAVKMAQSFCPDLIVTDLYLGAKGVGLTLIGVLRSLPVPVVCISSSVDAQDKADALEAGADAFAVKPAGLESIRSLVLGFIKNLVMEAA